MPAHVVMRVVKCVCKNAHEVQLIWRVKAVSQGFVNARRLHTSCEPEVACHRPCDADRHHDEVLLGEVDSCHAREV